VAAANGHPEAADALLQGGANVSATDGLDDTALLVAARRARAETVHLLLARGAAVDDRNWKGDSALFEAVRYGNPGIAVVLVEAGANINLENADHASPLKLAKAFGDDAMVALLERRGDTAPFTPWPPMDEDGSLTNMYDSPPTPREITRPQYPDPAFRKKVAGDVLVELLIDATGRVSRARVLDSVPMLDAAAVDCARTWLFEPAMKNDAAIPTIAHAPITFQIQ
jgi:TonB family protein